MSTLHYDMYLDRDSSVTCQRISTVTKVSRSLSTVVRFTFEGYATTSNNAKVGIGL